jgi:hypothetical protein
MKNNWLGLAFITFIGALFLLPVSYYYVRASILGTPGALPWGLPFPAGDIFLLFIGIFTVRRKSWRWGVAGLAVVAAMILYGGIVFGFVYI